MANFLLGVFVAVLAFAFGTLAWMRGGDGCFNLCSEGTACREHRCISAREVAEVPVALDPAKPQPRKRGLRALPPPSAALRPGDELVVSQGEALGFPTHLDMTRKDGPEKADLSQDQMDEVFRTAEPAILRCITEAVGDAPLDRGEVDVGLRIEASGEVSKVRVQAPGLLQRKNLTPCVRAAVKPLRFPASRSSNIVQYPFELK